MWTMQDFIQTYINPFIFLLEEMAPVLLLGFLIAGLLHAFVPQTFYRHYLGGDNLRSVLMAILVGIPLPLCSCGVIPTAVSMRKEGASRSATTSFLIATPQTGVDSIAATWSVLGLPFAILRPVAALLTALGGGLASILSLRLHKEDESAADAAPSSLHEEHDAAHGGFWKRIGEALHYGFVTMLSDIGGRLVIGLILAGLITIFVPDSFFTSYAGNELVNMLVLLVIAIPMYVCATGSIPIAAALILKGVSPGAALVFLMAGPAVNIASILVLGKQLGRRSVVIYVASVVIGSILMGLFTDYCLPAEWFTSRISAAYSDSCHEGGSWIEIVSAAVLVILLIYGFVHTRRHGHDCGCDDDGCCHEDHHHHHHDDAHGMADSPAVYKIKGMHCSHCAENVTKAISAVPGVKSVSVNHVTGEALVEGSPDRKVVVAAIESAGYQATG